MFGFWATTEERGLLVPKASPSVYIALNVKGSEVKSRWIKQPYGQRADRAGVIIQIFQVHKPAGILVAGPRSQNTKVMQAKRF